ncbi:sensor histidine kinase [Cryptosporangium aurantiacum]|uniref:histidine kinase n=1 Tax=Cryptosporangium aurantiacum TaxID=134849 RepID=A0A1M7RI17_9ACTN|nr:sensor histidine kinase [Cryptosporangium aurantiacum]SHN45904.1 Signal transduction histidine kinase [Cryptosporangium aurantiacum]
MRLPWPENLYRPADDRAGEPAPPVASWRALGVDAALAGAILVLFAVVAGPLEPGPLRAEDGPAWAIGLALVGVVPVALRRVAPLTATGLVCGAMLLGEWQAASQGVAAVAALILAYTRGALAPLRQAVLATLALGACGAAVGLVGPGATGPRWATVSAGLLALLACFFLGRTVFTRRAYTAALEERARVAELNRETAARQAVLDERRRIARELHDMVAHHVSVMGVLATGARRTLRRDPDAADEALRTIEDTGRASLREMRRLLDVLRSDDERAPEEPPPPAPGVAGLEQLVEQVREAGLPVELTVTGAATDLEPGVDLTVFRLVQEALTNTLKHAGAAHAKVALEFAVDGVRITVTDDGHGPAPGNLRLGHGLVGMRERVALYGGTLRTGARAGGGFRVSARLPLDGVSRSSPPPSGRTTSPAGATLSDGPPLQEGTR